MALIADGHSIGSFSFLNRKTSTLGSTKPTLLKKSFSRVRSAALCQLS